MRRFRIFFFILVTLPFLLFSAAAAVNYALDADHIFSKGPEYPVLDRGLKYYKNAGVINHYAIGSITVGGSLMDNVVPSEVEAALGWKNVYSLTLNASDAASVAAVTRYALSRHKISNVLYSLQPERLAEIPAAREGKRGGARNFIFLYDDSRLNDLMVLVQPPLRYLRERKSARDQKARLEKTFGKERAAGASRDLFSHYMARYRDFNRPLFISSLEDPARPPRPLTEENRRNLAENFDRHIRPLVEGNPATHFHFIVEPRTFIARRIDRHIFSWGLAYLAKRFSQYPNATLHVFASEPYNADLRLFKDLDHSHIEVSRHILQSVARGTHRLEAKEAAGYLRSLDSVLDAYRVPPLWQAEYRPLRDGPYPKEGYITYYDAAKLVWGAAFSDRLFRSIPRSPCLDEKTYVETEMKTWPPLDATRAQLETVDVLPARIPGAARSMSPPVKAALGGQ